MRLWIMVGEVLKCCLQTDWVIYKLTFSVVPVITWSPSYVDLMYIPWNTSRRIQHHTGYKDKVGFEHCTWLTGWYLLHLWVICVCLCWAEWQAWDFGLRLQSYLGQWGTCLLCFSLFSKKTYCIPCLVFGDVGQEDLSNTWLQNGVVQLCTERSAFMFLLWITVIWYYICTV